MNVSKRSLGIIAVAIFIAQLAIMAPARAFPGFNGYSDPSLCHNEPSTAYNTTYYSTAVLNGDGNNTEQFWNSSNTWGRRMEIPVTLPSGTPAVYNGTYDNGTKFSAPSQFVEVIFCQNATDLFILVNWATPTITGNDSEGGISDKVAITFNINATPFEPAACHSTALATTGGMTLANGSGETFVWQPDNASNSVTLPGKGLSANLTGKTFDYVLDSNGLNLKSTPTFTAAAILMGPSAHSSLYSYNVVFDRPLKVNDSNAVQFSQDGLNSFAIAVFNATNEAGHYMSYVHQVWVKGAVTASTIGLPEAILMTGFFSLLAIGAVVVHIHRKRQIKI